MIYVTGDMHADYSRFEERKIRKLKKNDILIICGDFGFIWDGSEKEEKILNSIGKKRFTTLFVDGNHENFDLLDKYEVTDWNGGKVQHISGNLYHLMRGQIYDLEGKKFFILGGGESEDKETRIEMGTWWPQEAPDINEMRKVVEKLDSIGRNVDYIITHEPPAHIKNLFDNSMRSLTGLNVFLDEISKQVKYKTWYFGNLHINRKITSRHQALFTDVVPLNLD